MRGSFWLATVIALFAATAVPAQDVPRRAPCLLPDPTDVAPQRPTVLPDYCPPPACPAQLAIIGEYRLLTPGRRETAYALSDPNTNAVPEGNLVSLDPARRSGFRVGAAYHPGGSPWEFAIFYTFFQTTDTQSVMAAPGGLLFPTQTRPGTVDTALTAAATYRLNYDLYDLEVGRNFAMDGSLGLRVVGGVRFASITQDFSAQYDGLSAAQAVATSHANFKGVGLIVGGEAHWTLGWGLSLFARTRAGIVVGDGTSRLTESNNAGASLLADVTDSFRQTVPVVEMGLGVAWSFRRFWVRLGYDATNWFQLVDSPAFVDSLSPGKIVRRESNLSLEGFFVQVGAAF
jgi:hypothetical protein